MGINYHYKVILITDPCENFSCPIGYRPKAFCKCIPEQTEGKCKPDKLSEGQEFWESITSDYINPHLETFSNSARSRGSRSWLALIEGKHPKYKFNRDFINTFSVERKKVVPIEELKVGKIIERGDNYYTGSGRKQTTREYFEILCVGEDGVLVNKLSESEALNKLE